MASTKDDADDNSAYDKPDAAKAFAIYDKQIAPKKTKLDTIKGDLSQPYDDIKQIAHFPRDVLDFIIRLENIDDDAKRDHKLLALSEGLRHRMLFLPRDLATMASGEAGSAIVGREPGDKPELATVAKPKANGSKTPELTPASP